MEKQHTKVKVFKLAMRNFFMYWLPVVAWMTLIFFLSSRHSITVSSEYVLNFIFFKFLHILEYGVLYALIVRVLLSYHGYRLPAVYAIAFCLTILYACTDEVHQTYVPTREGKVRDVIIDGIGAGIIWYFLRIQLPRAPKKLKNLAHSLGLIS